MLPKIAGWLEGEQARCTAQSPSACPASQQEGPRGRYVPLRKTPSAAHLLPSQLPLAHAKVPVLSAPFDLLSSHVKQLYLFCGCQHYAECTCGCKGAAVKRQTVDPKRENSDFAYSEATTSADCASHAKTPSDFCCCARQRSSTAASGGPPVTLRRQRQRQQQRHKHHHQKPHPAR